VRYFLSDDVVARRRRVGARRLEETTLSELSVAEITLHLPLSHRT
jgi:hypothetical protein